MFGNAQSETVNREANYRLTVSTVGLDIKLLVKITLIVISVLKIENHENFLVSNFGLFRLAFL